MQKNYKDKAIKSAENKEQEKKVEETFFFPPQDGKPEFSCQATSREEAEEKYNEFLKDK